MVLPNEKAEDIPWCPLIDVFGSKTWDINDFDIGKPLGRGIVGHVYLAREKTSKYLLAIKVLYKKQLQEYEFDVQAEIAIHSALHHPNIIRFYHQFQDE